MLFGRRGFEKKNEKNIIILKVKYFKITVQKDCEKKGVLF